MTEPLSSRSESERVPCPACGGRGMVESNTSTFPGMKYVAAPMGYCRMCDGTGWLPKRGLGEVPDA